MKSLVLSPTHFQQCHERWAKFQNRDLTKGSQPDAWLDTQCLTCAYYVSLIGAFSEDYGGCTNPNSPCDGRIMFEHDGCDAHKETAEHVQFSMSYSVLEM